MSQSSKKVSRHTKRHNLKIRKSMSKRRNKIKKRSKSKRPKRNWLGGQRFFSLEAFLRFLHRFLADLIDKKLKPKAPQAAYSNRSLFHALILRSLLGMAHLSRFVELCESNKAICKAIGLARPLKNTKPLTEFLLKLSFPMAKWLFLQVLLQARDHGLVFGKTVAIDCCFLHVYGKSYECARKGYSGQLKRTARGYKLTVVFSVESQMPLSFQLDSGNAGERAHFKCCIAQANFVLGEGQLKMVLADRGFCSRELYFWLDRVMHLKFVFRAKAGKTNVYVQSAIDAIDPRKDRKLGHLERYGKTTIMGFDGQKLRLFVGKHKKFKKGLLLVTNDFSLEYRKTKRIYLSRWSIESYFAKEKGSLALGKFSSTKWRIVFAEVTMSLVCSVLERVFQLLLGRRYRKFGARELLERVIMHGFDCSFEELMMVSSRRKETLVASLQRLFHHLERWEYMKKPERFEGYRPPGFDACLFERPELSVVP